MNTIGELIRIRRCELNLSQQDVALKTGLRQATISEIESGGNFEVNTLQLILKTLGGQLMIDWVNEPKRTDNCKP